MVRVELARRRTAGDATADEGAVTVATDGAALFVEPSTDLPGRFPDDHPHLASGEERPPRSPSTPR